MDEEEQEELIEVLVDMVNQSCRTDQGRLDSMGTSAYADGMLVLAKYGYVTIDSQLGRRVLGHWAREEEQ